MFKIFRPIPCKVFPHPASKPYNVRPEEVIALAIPELRKNERRVEIARTSGFMAVSTSGGKKTVVQMKFEKIGDSTFPIRRWLLPLALHRGRTALSAVVVDEIKELIHAEPIRPIRIVLGNEQSFVVAHTDYLMISPDRQTVLLYDQQGRFKIINAQQIRLVEPVPGPPSKRP